MKNYDIFDYNRGMDIAGIMKVTLLDFPEHVACSVFTAGCNLRCPFCYNSELVVGPVGHALSEEEFFAFLARRVGRLDGVAISGGEPTLQPDLGDFVRRVRELDMSVKLDTNGTHPEVVEALVADGLVDYIAMDIKSGPEGYPSAVGMDVDRDVMEAITSTKDLLLTGVVDYEFRTTVVGGIHSERDFYGIADFIRGARRYFLQCYRDDERVLRRDRGFYPPDREELVRYLGIVRGAVQEAALRGID